MWLVNRWIGWDRSRALTERNKRFFVQEQLEMPCLVHWRPASFPPVYPVQCTVEQVSRFQTTEYGAANTSSEADILWRNGWGWILQVPLPVNPHMLLSRYNDRPAWASFRDLKYSWVCSLTAVWLPQLWLRQQDLPTSVPRPRHADRDLLVWHSESASKESQ